MPTKTGFGSDDPPRFLSERAGKPEQPSFVALRDSAVNLLRAVVVTSALIGMVTAIGMLTVGDSAAIFGQIKTSLLDIPTLRIAFDQWKSAIQSTSTSKSMLQTAVDAPARYGIAAAFEAADQNQGETNQTSTEELFKQFQAWASEKDKRANVEPLEDPKPNLQIMKSQPQVWRVRYARAEVRSSRNSQKRSQQTRNVRIQVRPAQDAPAQTQSAQSAAARSSAQSFSSRD